MFSTNPSVKKCMNSLFLFRQDSGHRKSIYVYIYIYIMTNVLNQNKIILRCTTVVTNKFLKLISVCPSLKGNLTQLL